MAKSDVIATGLASSSDLSKEICHPGCDIRPCIAAILDTFLTKGQFPNRSAASVAIATELKRIGMNYDDTLRRIERWNFGNIPPLRPNDVVRAVNNAFTKDYAYSCQHSVLEAFCIGTEVCPFVMRVKSRKRKSNDLCFIDYGWPEILSNRQVLIYYVALLYLEKTRRIGPGGLICANHKQIADACGVSRERTGDDLKKLATVGLIEYNVGSPRRWEGIASEIRRVLPIPRSTKGAREILKNRKLTPRQIEICHNIERVSGTIKSRS
jgi:hypothetical protein